MDASNMKLRTAPMLALAGPESASRHHPAHGGAKAEMQPLNRRALALVGPRDFQFSQGRTGRAVAPNSLGS